MPTSYSVLDSGILLATVQTEPHTRRAYELATEYNHPTAYDAQYLAVAERYQCDFWTADERLFNAVSGRFPSIYWLGDVKLEA
ncbi:MAG: type II toxin-antitoxin system VapC family toxin [Anaerolineae bacterium]|nr:type II toxin-antitoxin system VapC family toxin [Anaerolineae bacterium]